MSHPSPNHTDEHLASASVRRSNRALSTLVFAAWLGFSSACGGTVTTNEKEGKSDNSGGGDGNAGGSGDESSGGAGSDLDTGSGSELPECKAGFKPGTDPENCTWLADKLCYKTKLAACACVCPRDRDSECISGFPGGPGDAVPVRCY